MTVSKVSSFVRLAPLVRFSDHMRRWVMAGAFVVSSAAGAAAAPITSSYQFPLDPDPLPTFDTSHGTLLGIEISLNAMLRASNPFTSDPIRHDGWCDATFTGGSLSASAAGTPTLLALDFSGTDRNPCDTYEFDVIKLGTASVDASFFDAFTSVGPSALTLILTKVAGTVSFTDGIETRSSAAGWLGSGQLTYTYCPVGQDCGGPMPVPEPTTAVMVTLGVAGLLARRWYLSS